MADLIKTALASLDSVQKSYQGQAVTYVRGAFSVEVTATPASSDFEITDLETGLAHKIVMQDWLIAAVDLILNASQVEPSPGDQVQYVIGSTTYTYEVVEQAGEQCFRYCDPPYRRRLRVHSKLIDTT